MRLQAVATDGRTDGRTGRKGYTIQLIT